MRRINIKTQDKLITRSYDDKSDFFLDLKFILDFPLHEIYRFKLAHIIWNLNVGTAYSCFGYRFSINSKKRAGNKMINNTRIGERI